MGFLSTRILSVHLHEYGALVILVYYILVYLESLDPYEMQCPENNRHMIANPYDL